MPISKEEEEEARHGVSPFNPLRFWYFLWFESTCVIFDRLVLHGGIDAVRKAREVRSRPGVTG